MRFRLFFLGIGSFIISLFSCNPYSQHNSEYCKGRELLADCFERKVSSIGEQNIRELICFHGNISAKHLIIQGEKDTLLNENITYSLHQNNKYLYLNNFTVFNETQLNQDGNILKKGEIGNISIALESTRDCLSYRLVFDFDSYSEESFMYKEQ